MTLLYRGFEGDINKEDGYYYGHVLGLDAKHIVSYEGETLDELKQSFKDSVDMYLDFCEE